MAGLIDKLIDEIGPGHMGSTAYDTAWAARLGEIDWELSSRALAWLAENQLPNGAWGACAPMYYHDRVLCTLAAMIALTYRGRRGHDKVQIENGKLALERMVKGATEGLMADPNGATVGFEMIAQFQPAFRRPQVVEVGRTDRPRLWCGVVLDVLGHGAVSGGGERRGRPGAVAAVWKKSIARSEGIHIITRKLTRDHIVTYGKTSKVGFFMLPWRRHTLIGLTDKHYAGDPDGYRVTRESILELLGTVNEYLGEEKKLRYEDILYTYGGLRPLVGDTSQDTPHMSRKYEIYDIADEGIEGMITVEGGKYTTSRNLAEQVLKTVGKKLKTNLGNCLTHNQHLAGCEIDDLPVFLEEIQKKNPGVDRKTIECLGRLYGTEYCCTRRCLHLHGWQSRSWWSLSCWSWVP